MSPRSKAVLVCLHCDQDLVHCHGTAIVNVDQSHVCSDDPECHLAVELHFFISVSDEERI